MVHRRLIFLPIVTLVLACGVSHVHADTSVASDLRTIADSVETAMELAGLDQKHPDVAEKLAGHLGTIRRIAAELDQQNVSFTTTLRLSKDEFHAALPEDIASRLQPSMDYIKNTAFTTLAPLLDTAVGEARTTSLLTPVDDYLAEETRVALARNLETLRKLEIKYGPNSARLNLLETVINHFLLRSIPAFGLSDDGNPGSLELITAYTTAYVARASGSDDNGLDVVSGVELGLRVYMFANGWGEGSPLKPAYVSFGALLSGTEDGVLREPFKTDPRWGGFVSWGALKLAVQQETGDAYRLLLSRQFQLVPALF